MVTLSVVMPNYNHLNFLEAAINAIVCQTRPPDEIIVVDDASTDESWPLIEALAARHPILRAERNIVNLGAIGTMRRGMKIAVGDYVCFSAADDVVAPDFCERVLSLLEQYPNAGLCSTLSATIDADNRFRGVFRSPIVSSKPVYLPPEQARRLLLHHDSWCMGNVTIYRRQALIDAGGFAEELGSFTDGFICRVLASRHGACFIPALLGAWRRMEDGYSSAQGRNIAWQLSIIPVVEQLVTHAFVGVFPPAYLQRWRGRWRFAAAQIAVRLPENRSATLLTVLEHPNWLDRTLVALLIRCGQPGTRGLALYMFLRLRGGDLFTVAMLYLQNWRLSRDPEFTRYWRQWSEKQRRTSGPS